MSCDTALYISQHPSHGWAVSFEAFEQNPETEVVIGPLSWTGRSVTGTFTPGSAAVITVSSSTGDVVLLTGGEFRVTLTAGEVATFANGEQVLFDFTIWANSTNEEEANGRVVFEVRAG